MRWQDCERFIEIISMHSVLTIFIILLVIRLIAELWLDGLNRKEVLKNAHSVPDAFREFIDPPTYEKSVAYTLAKNQLSKIETVFDATILALVILSEFLPWVYEGLANYLGHSIWAQSIILIIIGFVLGVPSLPLEWWNQFRLEERFGFNKSTLQLWLMDKVKGLLIGLVIGYPMLCILLWIVHLPHWWIWAFIISFCFQLLMMVIYPMFIMPLFNKFEPLPEGDLRERLMALADRTGFKAKTILVMDGSKRSAHSNAFFTGFGKIRRIVLYDTLMEQLKPEELEAVLAHEIGHYKLGHIPKMIFLSGLMMLIGFWVLAKLAASTWFYVGFSFSPDSDIAIAFLLFSLISGLFTFWLSSLFNLRSRKHEFEADNFSSKALNTYKPLIDSLRKLSEKNLSNLTPHPLYSRFHYSHPTLIERERALAETPSPENTT